MLRRSERRAPVTLGPPTDKEFQAKWPTVWDHLTQTKWEDGSPRATSTIGIYPDAGIIRVLFRDRDSGMMTWVALVHLSDLWQALESVLNDPGADWRVDRRLPGDQATRVKAPQSLQNGIDKRKRGR